MIGIFILRILNNEEPSNCWHHYVLFGQIGSDGVNQNLCDQAHFITVPFLYILLPELRQIHREHCILILLASFFLIYLQILLA